MLLWLRNGLVDLGNCWLREKVYYMQWLSVSFYFILCLFIYCIAFGWISIYFLGCLLIFHGVRWHWKRYEHQNWPTFINIVICRLTLRHEELRSSLTNLQISESDYTRLRRTPAQQLTLQQFTAVRKSFGSGLSLNYWQHLCYIACSSTASLIKFNQIISYLMTGQNQTWH